MRPGEVIEAVPLAQFRLEIDIVPIAEQLIGLLLIWTVRALDLSIQLRRTALDRGVADTLVFDMPIVSLLEMSREYRHIYKPWPAWDAGAPAARRCPSTPVESMYGRCMAWASNSPLSPQMIRLRIVVEICSNPITATRMMRIIAAARSY